jgi:hypothetical protein
MVKVHEQGRGERRWSLVVPVSWVDFLKGFSVELLGVAPLWGHLQPFPQFDVEVEVSPRYITLHRNKVYRRYGAQYHANPLWLLAEDESSYPRTYLSILAGRKTSCDTQILVLPYITSQNTNSLTSDRSRDILHAACTQSSLLTLTAVSLREDYTDATWVV